VRLESDQGIATLLNSVQRIAVLGVSANIDRPSHRVFRFPVNPLLTGQELLGRPVFESLAQLPGTVDMVDVFRDSRFLPDITTEVISLQIPALWTQLGVTHADAETTASEAGVRLVVDRCPAIEIPRLQQLGLMQPST
jgi:predicted CoA-binding protein